MTTIRIAHHTGVIRALLLRRVGDYAETREAAFASAITHVPTGMSIRGSRELTTVQQTRLLEMLAVLPRWDLQSFDQELVAGLVEAVRKEVAA